MHPFALGSHAAGLLTEICRGSSFLTALPLNQEDVTTGK
uniref:Uncharacterized protein n=1 Tax=Anguilla anguilla TaxID=7936 RepID=A0A0E9VZ43_ANGAN